MPLSRQAWVYTGQHSLQMQPILKRYVGFFRKRAGGLGVFFYYNISICALIFRAFCLQSMNIYILKQNKI